MNYYFTLLSKTKCFPNTPYEFVLIDDFNIHVDKPTDSFSSQFLSSLSAFSLIQHVSFPTLDIVIISVSSELSSAANSTVTGQ